ncbi:MAG: NfeD family protein [Planctomycetota bacterium]
MEESSASGTLIASILVGVAAFGIFAVEIFVPTGGLLAVLCILCAVSSVVLGFMHDATLGMSLLALYSIAAPFMLIFGLKMAARSPLGRRMVLSAEDPARTGAGIPDHAAGAPAVGSTGTAITPLRPSGFVSIGGRRLDASAEGDLIDAGTEVEVVAVRDGGIRVRPRAAAGRDTLRSP